MSDDAYRKAFDDGYSDGYDARLRKEPDGLWPYAVMACIGFVLGLLVGWAYL